MDGAHDSVRALLQHAKDRGHRVISFRYLKSGSMGHSTLPGPRLSEHIGLANVQRGSADGDGSHDRHRLGFQIFWKAQSRPATTTPRVPADTVALIRAMTRDNRLWGADRICGELFKLGIKLSKRTIQKYMRRTRPPRRSGQT